MSTRELAVVEFDERSDFNIDATYDSVRHNGQRVEHRGFRYRGLTFTFEPHRSRVDDMFEQPTYVALRVTHGGVELVSYPFAYRAVVVQLEYSDRFTVAWQTKPWHKHNIQFYVAEVDASGLRSDPVEIAREHFERLSREAAG